MDNQGCILLARKITESEIWSKNPAWFKIWIYILTKVNFRDGKSLKRGQGFFNFTREAELLGSDITRHSVDHCLRWLKSAEQIATQKASRGIIISVLHYDQYQNIKSYKSGTESGTQSVTPAEQKRNTGVTNKEERNKNNKEIRVSNTDVLEQKLPEKGINYFIGLFKDVNPSYSRLFSNKTERAAMERIMAQYGAMELENLLFNLPAIVLRPYAPRITTPCELERKMASLLIFLKREQNGNISISFEN